MDEPTTGMQCRVKRKNHELTRSDGQILIESPLCLLPHDLEYHSDDTSGLIRVLLGKFLAS